VTLDSLYTGSRIALRRRARLAEGHPRPRQRQRPWAPTRDHLRCAPAHRRYSGSHQRPAILERTPRTAIASRSRPTTGHRASFRPRADGDRPIAVDVDKMNFSTPNWRARSRARAACPLCRTACIERAPACISSALRRRKLWAAGALHRWRRLRRARSVTRAAMRDCRGRPATTASTCCANRHRRFVADA